MTKTKCFRLLPATAVSERGDWAPWSCCDVCHQRLKGPALLAMGRACWKLYAPLADDDERRCRALTVLGLCGNQISGAPRHRRDVFPRSRICAMAWRFHAIDAMLSP